MIRKIALTLALVGTFVPTVLVAQTNNNKKATVQKTVVKKLPPCSTYCAGKYGHNPSHEAQCLTWRGNCAR